MNIFSIVFTLVSFKLSGVPAQQAGAGRLRSLPSSPLDGDVEKRLPLSTEQPPGRRTERYACLIHTNKAAVDSCYSSVGRGQCKDRHGNDYGRANYDRTDTNDLSAFSAEHCAYMCAGKPDGNQNLVGFDFADSIKVCACRFTAGYITDGNTTPGQGNCPSDASDPTSSACKPSTGVGAIDGSGGDPRLHCYRNNEFREQDKPYGPAPARTDEPTPSPTPSPTDEPTYSSVGKGKCKDTRGYYYGYAVYDSVDSANDCAQRCAPNGNQNLVGFEFADSYKTCLCRFTVGYITHGDSAPGQGNCPSDAPDLTRWGNKPCTPNAGVGAIDGPDGAVWKICYRNNNFRESNYFAGDDFEVKKLAL